ncbi:MAG: hypothetical protein ABS36_09820 [Acidobacteria bacterium SCN 69-37]|nr:MAG: hypothetical protein ABS36_09820 [Acidobacteria bacterium SCN 69-37]
MPADRFTSARGAVWPIETAGDGPPVLALHGVGGGAYFFRGLAGRLDDRYRVIATDLPSGLAPDGSVAPADMATWADDLVEYLAAREREPVVVVGHSLGTILALELWRRAPRAVRALVFVGGVPRVRDQVRPRLADRADAIEASHRMDGWGARIAPGVFGPRALRERPELVGLFERLLEAHPPATYVRNMRALLAASAVDVVSTVTVPCLSISGTDDAYAPPESVEAFLDQLPQPCARVMMDGVGHMPFFEAPAEFARAVGTFLAMLSRD